MFRHATPSRIDQKWIEQKKKLQLLFSSLSDADLQFETGRKHEMIDRIGIKLGLTETQIKNVFQSL